MRMVIIVSGLIYGKEADDHSIIPQLIQTVEPFSHRDGLTRHYFS